MMDYVTTLYAVSWSLGSLVIIVCTARICGRAFVTHQTGWDDFFMIFGALSAIVCSALVTVGASHGLGKHEHDIEDPHNHSEAIKYTIIAPVMSIISSSSSKVSIFIFLIRLMGVTAKRWHLYFLWGLCVLMGLLNLYAIVLILRFCSPTAYQWDKSLDGTCIDPKIHAAAATIAKVGIFKDLDKHQDITWFWAPITLLYTAEMDVIIIVGTIPALWPLLKFVRRPGGGSYGPYKNASSNPEQIEGSEAYQLENSKNSKVKQGPITRALQELDELRTMQTVVGNAQP
ncbi:hypothetical protein Hte_011992 [Hypoxylon texense]